MKCGLFNALTLAFTLCHTGALFADTTITYQGRLDSGGQPHTGTVGLVFQLYNHVSGGNQQGPTLNRNVLVTEGLFQAELDFGTQPYEAGRWLQITVNGQVLTPRQHITGAPFALRAIPSDDCPTLAPDDEMVRVGGVCIDKYEASVWDAPVGGNQLFTKEQIRAVCPDDGQDCHGKIFARSVAGVIPAGDMTWFQAQQALANSGKRLLTNAEWQMAVSGTPDHPGPCNTTSGAVRNTGAESGCVSDWGVFDMVGNLWEFIADWGPVSTECLEWADHGDFSSDDAMCLAGASTTMGPGSWARGGRFNSQFLAGPFAVDGFSFRPTASDGGLGFRGAR